MVGICTYSILSATTLNAQIFGDPHVLYVGTGTPIFVDMDTDGLPDGVVPKSDSLFFLHNNGSGFDPPTLLTPLGQGTSVKELVDLDSNGQLDVVFFHTSMDDQGVYHDSLGVIWLDPEPARTHLDSTHSANTLYVADLDGDGTNDLVYRNLFSDPIMVHMNNGDRTFTTRSYPSMAGLGGTVVGFYRPYDWDGDGDVDLMGGIGLNGNLAVSYNIDGELGYPFTEVDASLNLPPQTDVVDLDADGIEDYVAANNAFLRSPAGGIEIKCCFGSFGQRHLGDLDCDPAIEIISPGSSNHGNGFDADLVIWDLAISGFVQRQVLFDTSFAQFQFDILDVNNDGLDDIAYRVQEGPIFDTLFYRINETVGPVVTIDPPDTMLPGDTVVSLDWGQPEGGLYSGPGVFDNMLYVALTNSNAVEITYLYSDPVTTCVGEASATLQTAVGIRATAAMDGSSVFPNPTTGNINFRAGPGGATFIRIDDAMGRTIQELNVVHMEQGQVLNIPLMGMDTGLYFLNAQSVSGEVQRLPFMRTSNAH